MMIRHYITHKLMNAKLYIPRHRLPHPCGHTHLPPDINIEYTTLIL